MDGSYLNYSNLMNSAVADATQKASQEKEAFESKLAKVGAEKSELLDLTNLAVMPFEAKVSKEGLSALSKGVDKISGGKITEFNKFINKKLTRVKTNAEKQLEKVKDKFKSKEEQEAEPQEETSEAPSGESGEVVAPEAVETTDSAGIDLYSFKDIAQDSGLYREYIRKTQPDYEGNDDLIEQSRQADLTNINNGLENGDRVVFLERGERDSLAPMRDEMMRRQQEAQPEDEGAEGNSNVDVANNQARSDVAEQTSTTEQNAVDSASNNAVRDAGENAGIDAGGAGVDADAGAIAGNVAGDVADAGAGGALMDNPFTFFIGLALMIGGIVGGVEGSRSIKNPTPKPVAVPNVSTQFGM